MLLQVNNIDVAYDEFQVIWDVSISIDQGEMVALLGPKWIWEKYNTKFNK